jgi:hypothetical protein
MKSLRLLSLSLILILSALSLIQAEPARSTGRAAAIERSAKIVARHRRSIERTDGVAVGDIQGRPLKDQGNVAIMQDDGTLIVPLNRFDLSNRSVTFLPRANDYQVITGPAAYETVAGNLMPLTLQDDDTYLLALPFPFVFYGITHNSVYVNTDGNLTFNESDTSHSDRDLRRVVEGAPRIAPLLDDFLPNQTGHISVTAFPDHVRVDWQSINEYARTQPSTFQVILNSNGIVQFNYLTVNIVGGVVGMSPGKGATLETIDFSEATPDSAAAGIVAEVFSNIEELDLSAISATFLQTHADHYDALFIFSDFSIDLRGSFAYEVPIRNDIQGIMPGADVFDFGQDYGSPARLSSLVNAGSISNYVLDPQQDFLGTNNTLEVLGQEFGHRWLAYLDTNPPSLLGRDQSHWSFFMNSEGSVMEGNQIQDLGNGVFRTVGATFRYSPLDQYIMGLRDASEVPPWFVVSNPRLIFAPPDFKCFPMVPACAPALGVDFSGIRRNVTIDDLTALVGPRAPSAADSQKAFSVAFILITRRGQEANAGSVAHVENIRRQWEPFFAGAVDGRASMSTGLVYTPTTRMAARLPASGSTDIESVPEGDVQAGYGTLQQGFGVAVLRSFTGSKLIAEAAVPGSPAATHWIMYAEKEGTLSTGVAVANPSAVTANLTLRLNDGRQAALQLPAHTHRAAFVEQLLGISGSFLGTMTIDSDVPVTVLALRGSLNPAGDFIITTIPVTSAVSPIGNSAAFPMIADGGPYKTEILLVNAGAQESSGTIHFSSGGQVAFRVAPQGIWRIETPGTSPEVESSSAMLIMESGPLPDASVVIRFSTSEGLLSETGVPAQQALSHGMMFGSTDGNLRTGLAVYAPVAANVQLIARNGDGTLAGSGVLSLQADGRISAFLEQMMSNLPANFHGTISFDADAQVYAVSIRGTTVENGGFEMSTVPILDVTKTLPSPSYFPQIAIGTAFTTEFLIANPFSSAFDLTFTRSNGEPFPLPLKNWFRGY